MTNPELIQANTVLFLFVGLFLLTTIVFLKLWLAQREETATYRQLYNDTYNDRKGWKDRALKAERELSDLRAKPCPTDESQELYGAAERIVASSRN